MTRKKEPILVAEYNAQVRRADGSEVEAIFTCFDDSMVNFDQPCRLILGFEGEELTAMADDFFAALDKIRQKLEAEGMVPLVNGASRTSYPSGMARDMGQGLSVYRLRLGKPVGDLADLVDTFEADAIDQISTVKDQREFFEAWLRSFPE